MLWHTTHISWFEFNMGSRLVQISFPERYRKEAQDKVKIAFKQPGPNTRENKPIIKNVRVRLKMKEKI